MSDLRPETQYLLPDELRAELAEPFGPVVDTAGLQRNIGPDDTVLAVGDVVSLSLKGLGITPKLFVCDYKTQRGAESSTYRTALSAWGDLEATVSNPAGTVTRGAWDAVREAVGRPEAPFRIVVEGEEDLLGIPCLLEAPDGAIVVYGAPGRGAVLCRVDGALRARVADLVGRMPTE